MYNGFWLYFWEIALIVSCTVFGGITLLVGFKGGAELVRMFRGAKRGDGR